LDQVPSDQLDHSDDALRE